MDEKQRDKIIDVAKKVFYYHNQNPIAISFIGSYLKESGLKFEEKLTAFLEKQQNVFTIVRPNQVRLIGWEPNKPRDTSLSRDKTGPAHSTDPKERIRDSTREKSHASVPSSQVGETKSFKPDRYVMKPKVVKPPENVHFIENVRKAEAAVKAICSSSMIAVDCEGVFLSKDGKICLIQIATMKKQIYIFDLISIGSSQLESIGLKSVLESKHILKVFHDCEMDAEALYHQCDVRLTNVFDTQIAYTRLARMTSVPLNKMLKEMTSGKHNKLKEWHAVAIKQGPLLWEKRPLSINAKNYAAQDVEHLLQAHDSFKSLLQPDVYEEILEATTAMIGYTLPRNAELHDYDTEIKKITSKGEKAILRLDEQRRVYFPMSEDSFRELQLDPELKEEEDENNKNKFFGMFSDSIAQLLLESIDLDATIVDVCMDSGRNLEVNLRDHKSNPIRGVIDYVVRPEDIEQVIRNLGGEQKIRSDNRIGIDSTLHRVSVIRNKAQHIVGITARYGRAIQRLEKVIYDQIIGENSLLLLGPPGSGKTTHLRNIARILSCGENKRVIVVDTSDEIAGSGDIPHSTIGTARRIQVPKRETQHKILIEAVQNHTPEVIIIDEVGTLDEVRSCMSIARRGVRLIATAHGKTLDCVMQNRELIDLLGGKHAVILSAMEKLEKGAKSKTVQERKDEPVFQVVVELQKGNTAVLHKDVAGAVDKRLANNPIKVEKRQLLEEGDITIVQTSIEVVPA